MELVRFATAAALLDAAERVLVVREAENNLVLGILATLRDAPGVYPEPPYLGAITEGGEVVLVAVRTPPLNLVLSEPAREEVTGCAVEVLARRLAGDHPALPGVVGPRAAAAAFADRWAAVTGRPAREVLAERVYRARTARAPEGVPGTWREADEADRPTLVAWAHAFQAEALPAGAPAPDPEALAAQWVAGTNRTAYLWEAGDEPVSLVVAGSPTPHGIRIGPVYTPPDRRGHRYASALTAAVTRHHLDRGRAFCFLFTDLANPTSNRIYRRIGYAPVSGAAQYQFET